MRGRLDARWLLASCFVRSRRFERLANVSGGVVGQTMWVAGGRLISNLALAGVAVITARRLGVQGRGAFVLFVTVGTFISLMADLGVPIAGRVHLVSQEQRVSLGEYLGLCLVLSLASGVLSSGIGMVALSFADLRPSGGDAAALGLFGALLLAARSTVSALAAYGHNRTAAKHDAFGSIVRLTAVATATQIEGASVGLFLAALSAGDAVQVTTSILAMKRRGHAVTPQVSAAIWRRIVRTGVPAVGLSLWQTLAFRIDRYIVGVLLSPAAVGIYSVAATLTEAIRLPGYGLGQVFFHRVASGKASPGELRRARRWCLLTTALIAGVVFVTAPSIVRFLFGEEFTGSVTSARVLLLAELVLSSFLIDGVSLVALRRPGLGAAAAFAALVAIVAADVVLVPRFGIIGAAWASVVSYLVMATMARRFLIRLERSA